MDLSNNYTDVSGQILRMTPLPSIAKDVSMLTQEEGQNVQINDFSTALFSKTSGENYRGNRQRFDGNNSNNHHAPRGKLFCEHCHGETHTREKCFYLHGYPEWHPQYGSKSDPAKMPKNKGKGKVSHSMNASTSVNAVIQGSANSNISSGAIGNSLTQEQYHELLSILNNSVAGNTNSGSPLDEPVDSLVGKHLANPVFFKPT